MKKPLSILSLALLAHCSFADVAPGQGINTTLPQSEHVVWTGQPIAFSVPVGQERLINFPGAITFKNLDPSLTADKVAITNNDGTLYIKALQAFAPVRTYVQIKSTGEVVYLDLSGSTVSDDTAVSVVTNTQTTPSTPTNPTTSAAPTYLSMLQYAVAQVYWPDRLLTTLKTDPSYFNFGRTPMYTTHSVYLFAGTPITAMPEASWRNGNLFVTAVLLLNPNRETVQVNPFQNLIGSWQAASLYPTNYLTPQGTAHDRTMLFLVSNQPFNAALHQITDFRQEQ